MLIFASIWNRINWETWHQNLPLIGFCCFFLTFIAVVIITMRMKKDKVDHLSNLPLDDNPSQKETKDDTTTQG